MTDTTGESLSVLYKELEGSRQRERGEGEREGRKGRERGEGERGGREGKRYSKNVW